MHSIIAPRPTRLIVVDPATRNAPLFPSGMPSSSSCILIEDDDPFISHSSVKPKPESISYPRLLSPIALPDRSRKLLSKSPTPCNSIKKSSALNAPRSPRRRRHGHSTRRPCGITPLHFPRPSTSVFDDLAWISTLDDPTLAQDPWAIGDLSTLPVPSHSGPGPIRRRKLSTEARAELEPLRAAELARASLRTPPPRRTPSSALDFHNLMPVWTPQQAP